MGREPHVTTSDHLAQCLGHGWAQGVLTALDQALDSEAGHWRPALALPTNLLWDLGEAAPSSLGLGPQFLIGQAKDSKYVATSASSTQGGYG